MKEAAKPVKGTRYKFTIPAIAAICGILLIGISFISESRSSLSHSAYKTDLEKRVERIICSATGSDKVDVLITLKDKASAKADGSTRDVFSYGKSDNSTAYAASEIAGVMIVCRGITSREDFSTLKSAVATVLDISQSKIYIIGGEQSK